MENHATIENFNSEKFEALAMYMNYCLRRRQGDSHAFLKQLGFPDVYETLYQHIPKTE